MIVGSERQKVRAGGPPVPPASDGIVAGPPLRSRHLAMITVGSIIGAGLFVGSTASIATVGPAVVISYGAAGMLILLIMRIVTQMATSNARTGSFTELVRQGLGDWGGFVAGWMYWYFWVVVVPIESLAAANILHLLIPIPAWQIGVALLGATTAINLVSVRSYGELEFWLSLIKVTGLVLFTTIAAAYLARTSMPNHPAWSNLYAHGGFAPCGTAAIIAGVASAVFALTGAEMTTIAAAESTDPLSAVRGISRSLAFRILLFYMVPVTLILAIIPWNTVKPGVSPFATALSAMHIPGAAAIMNIIVLAAVLSYLNSALYATSRVLFVLASKGDAPRWLTHVRGKAPARAVVTSSLFGYLALCASILSPEVVFSFLINTSGATMMFIYGLLCLAQLRKHGRKGNSGAWFYPWSTYVAILGIATVLVAMAVTAQLASQLYSSLLVAAMVSGAFVLRRRQLPRPIGEAVMPEAPPKPAIPI